MTTITIKYTVPKTHQSTADRLQKVAEVPVVPGELEGKGLLLGLDSTGRDQNGLVTRTFTLTPIDPSIFDVEYPSDEAKTSLVKGFMQNRLALLLFVGVVEEEILVTS